jgi:NAD(P)H-dependent FMN reductase
VGPPPLRLLLISGSTRPASTNTAALRTAVALTPAGVEATLYDRLVELPAFVPEPDAPPPPVVAALLHEVTVSDAVVLSTPEYAGTLPGAFKNLLDWTVGGGELVRKPVAIVTVAPPGRGTGADTTLRTVLGYVDADLVDEACVRVYVARDAVDGDGLVTDQEVQHALRDAIERVVAHLHR